MAEDKDEGEVQATSIVSSVEEEEKTRGLDSQISTIEDQLSKAQASLFELQKARAKLEIEKRDNMERARLEKEAEEAKKIKRENQKLRQELNEYHEEIGSLKDIIGSLKDNLVKTAERLEQKVDNSLKSLEHKETHAKHRSSHDTHQKDLKKTVDRNFFSDHLEMNTKANDHSQPSKPVLENKTDESSAPTDNSSTSAVSQASEGASDDERGDIKTESIEQKEIPQNDGQSAPVAEIVSNAPADIQDQPKSNSENSPNPDSNSEHSEKSAIENFWEDQPKEAETKNIGAFVSQVENQQESAQTVAEDLIEEGLDEYEEIRKELLALEGESIFQTMVDKTEPDSRIENVADLHKDENNQVAESKNDNAGPLIFAKKLFKRTRRSKIKSSSAEDKAVNTSLPNNETNISDTKTDVNIQNAPAQPTAPLNTVQQSAVDGKEAGQQDNATSSSAIKPTPEATPADNQQPPSADTAGSDIKTAVIQEENQKKKEKSGIANIKNIFKKKKPKIKGHVDDSSHNNEKMGPTGRMVVGSAVVLLLIAGGVLTIKLMNAKVLRETYTSKAVQAVTSGNANAKLQEVPDEFANHDPRTKYKEAYVDAPYEETTWLNYQDPEIGISIDYPKNTSYRLKPVGSNNVWFLRKDGFLLKIEKVETALTLDEYAAEMSKNIQYQQEKLVIRGKDTIHMILDEDLPVKGNIYLSKYDNGIFKIWYKTFESGEDMDDQKRVQKMLDTLDFISAN